MNKYFSIVGGGLTGLTAAKALHINGITNFKIFDIKTPETIGKERIKGLHYLHANPMQMQIPKDSLTNFIKSDADDMKLTKKAYLEKTGLIISETESSLDKLQKHVEFWDIRAYRKQLIESFGDKYVLSPVPIDNNMLIRIAEHSIATFYTINISQIITSNFMSIMIFGRNDLPPERYTSQLNSKNWVIYNTSKMEQWYRASFILGNAWLESTDSLFGVYIGEKIITFPEDVIQRIFSIPNVYLIGRYATWNRKILIHNVYNAVDRMVKDGIIRANV